MRLRLTNSKGMQTSTGSNRWRRGLLNEAVVEGGNDAGGLILNMGRGEILLAACRSCGCGGGDSSLLDATTPCSPSGQRIIQRVEATYSWIPTVPVMHLKVVGHMATAYGIGHGRRCLRVWGRKRWSGSPDGNG